MTADQARKRWKLRKNKQSDTAELIAALARSEGIRTWEVPADFPLGLARKLARKRVRLVPASPFFPERSIKKTHEVECIREGVRLAETGLARALDVLQHSSPQADGRLLWNGATLTAEILRGEIDAEIARAGGTASHTIAAPGTQGADPHESGHGPVQAGVPIVIDIFPRVDRTGYFGDLTRTVVKGKASDIVRQAYEAVNSARKQAVAAVRPGIPGNDVHKTAADELEACGFRTDTQADPPRGFFHGTGHGLGLQVHEAPRLSPSCDEPLEAGHVVTVEPGLYYPEWGGVRIEDVVVVTADGCENLTSADCILEIP
jgi:Xaa-Pro aminopeptidase